MELILSGNPNLNTITTVIYAVYRKYNAALKKIYFIDNPGTVKESGKREQLVRQLTRMDIQITTRIIEKSQLNKEIPIIVSEELQLYKKEEILIDLTNGDKAISNILFAAAYFSRIKTVFIFISPQFRDTSPELIPDEHLTLEESSTVENINLIGRHSFFEILFYKEEVNKIIRKFKDYQFEDPFHNLFEGQMNGIVANYFQGNYSDALNSLRVIIESYTDLLCRRIQGKSNGVINAPIIRGFYEKVHWLGQNFCNRLRDNNDHDFISTFPKSYLLLKNIDTVLHFVRVYGNNSSHPSIVLRDEPDARMTILNAFYFFNLVIESGVFE